MSGLQARDLPKEGLGTRKPGKISVEVRRDARKEGEKVDLAEGDGVGDLLRALGLLREEHVVMVAGKVVTEVEKLENGDEVRIIRAFSGG